MDELNRMARLALPVIAAQVGGMLMGAVDTIMVGRVSVEALAAAAMANAWIFALLFFGQGLVMGIDPMITQAHGARRGDLVAIAFHRGILLALAISIPLAVGVGFTEEALLVFGQQPDLARQAQTYASVQVASVPFFLLFVATRQWLQGREIMRPAMWTTLIANVFNALANYVFIFGALGVPAMGLLGAGIATALTRGIMLMLLVAWVLGFRLGHGAWVTPSRVAFEATGLRRALVIGLAVAVQMSLEIWAFSLSTLLAGRIGAASLAAHSIALNMAALTFMMPLGVSQAAVTRVGNLIGAGEVDRAQRAAWVALGLGAACMAIPAVLFVLLRSVLPRIYTSDAATIALCAAILPIAGIFQIFDGVQVAGSGVLRGMGRTRPAALFNLIGYWLVGLPLGGWLVLRMGLGLPGIWWGLAIGLALVASAMVVFVAFRGPGVRAR